MEQKHTPGPWETIASYDRRHGEIPVMSKNHGAKIGAASASHMSWDECGANARLIAAAPELLEALTAARGAIASLGEFDLGGVDIPDTRTGDSVGQYGIRDALLSDIDAALTKAAS